MSLYYPGGDEVQFQCYNSSEKVKKYMVSKGWDPSCPSYPEKNPSASTIGSANGTSSLLPSAAQPNLYKDGCANGGVGYKHLVADFIRQVHTLARNHNRTPSGWQEIWDHYGGNTSATPTPPFEGLGQDVVIYDWLAPEWGWGNIGTISSAGWPVVSTLGQ